MTASWHFPGQLVPCPPGIDKHLCLRAAYWERNLCLFKLSIYRLNHLHRMSHQSLIYLLNILNIMFPAQNQDHKIPIFQNLLKVTLWINFNVCYSSQSSKINPTKIKTRKINLSPLRSFEEPLPSLLQRSFMRRKEVANNRQKVQQEVC